MQSSDIDKINENLLKGALHLFEASKYLSDLDTKFAARYAIHADRLLSMIKPVEEKKVSETEINSILDEIFNSGE